MMDILEQSNELIQYGVDHQLQDLYLYVDAQKGVAKFRKNEQTFVYQSYASQEARQLISRFKFLGEMDIGETRKAQLGAITYQLNERAVRLRLSTVGDYRGFESLVIRFLVNTDHEFTYEQVATYDELVYDVANQNGLFLFSGATGSGKTTLMYHLAKKLGGQVITIEDPVEIEEPTFLQLQTNDTIGQTYDQLIKLSLRHRPDLLLIGEIRDSLTAHAAIRAALTGHQVFATVHAKGQEETVARLLELGCSQWEIDNCLKGIIYQRLQSVDDKTTPIISYKPYESERNR